MALLGVLVLVLAGYLVNEALRSEGTVDTSTAPDAPAVRQPVQPIPTARQPPPEPANPAEELLGVFINPTAYLGERASDAAFTAKSRGLVPEVVDENGDQVDRDRRSQCRVVEVDPEFRFVASGSTLELTCRRVR